MPATSRPCATRRSRPPAPDAVRFGETFYRTPLYNLLLGRRGPKALSQNVIDPWPGDPAEADRLFQGQWRFGDEEHVARQGPWAVGKASPQWWAELHGFAWLRHFHATGNDTAARAARGLVGQWLDRYGRYQDLAWRPDVTGRRLMSWLAHARFVLNGADPVLRHAYLASAARQVRHLSRTRGDAAAGLPRLSAELGHAMGHLALGSAGERNRGPLAAVAEEVTRQILADGGHASRNPEMLHVALRDLVAFRATLMAAQVEPPEAVQVAIDRMGPMLRFFRHGDGGLALFHGGGPDEAVALDYTLAQADARGKPLDSATPSGFERAAARRALLLLDAGTPPPFGRPHAGALAFEFSHGKDRLIGNCGAPWRGDGGLAQALAQSGAHSTMTLADSEPFAGADAANPGVVATREENEGNVWLEASHDGWRRRLGLTHKRRLFLAATGEDLRGEDVLDGDGLARAGGRRWDLRFHLHPGVQASLQGGGAVLLRSASGMGWQFRATGGTVTVEESLHFGSGRERRRAQQIVLGGLLSPGEAVRAKWALAKVGG